MQQFFSYWFWPNPAGWHYADPKVQAVLAACALLIIVSLGIRYWRTRVKNPVTRKLSGSWASAAMTFGIIGAVLAVSRVETIQFVSMRILWALWALCMALYAVFQVIQFRRRHYVVMARARTVDAREKYLPRKKR